MRPSRQPEASSVASEGSGEALGVAFAYLNRRERTVAEVRARLQRADLHAAAIDEAIAELVDLGYLDDARYARVFVEDKRSLEDWGRDRIERGLRERGVDRDLVDAALGAADSSSEIERALELLVRRYPAGSPTEQRDRERAFGVLIRKGYDSEVAAEAVRAWRAGHRAPVHYDECQRTNGGGDHQKTSKQT